MNEFLTPREKLQAALIERMKEHLEEARDVLMNLEKRSRQRGINTDARIAKSEVIRLNKLLGRKDE